jgi:hypothetical protein
MLETGFWNEISKSIFLAIDGVIFLLLCRIDKTSLPKDLYHALVGLPTLGLLHQVPLQSEVKSAREILELILACAAPGNGCLRQQIEECGCF